VSTTQLANRAIACRENGSLGGEARAARYAPIILSEWASKGGKAVLRKYGGAYFVQLRKLRTNYPKHSEKPPANWVRREMKLISARENGRIGGYRRAELYSAKCRQAMARQSGIATRNRYGSEFFREIRNKRRHYLKGYITKKTKRRIFENAVQNAQSEPNWGIRALWLAVAQEFQHHDKG
jgi:hypothetical protein